LASDKMPRQPAAEITGGAGDQESGHWISHQPFGMCPRNPIKPTASSALIVVTAKLWSGPKA
jgi:hypothetical protein